MSFHAEVTMTGKITADMNWISFIPGDDNKVIPITIAVFPNNKWNLETDGCR